jgi:hypothetical protein
MGSRDTPALSLIQAAEREGGDAPAQAMAGRESPVIPDESLIETSPPGAVNVTSAGVFSGGATFVAVVQAAYLAECHDHAGTGRLDGSQVRHVFGQGEVRTRSVVVREVRLEDRA